MAREKTELDEMRMQRDDLAALLRRMIHGTREGQPIDHVHKSGLRKKAQDYLNRHGLNGSIIRTNG